MVDVGSYDFLYKIDQDRLAIYCAGNQQALNDDLHYLEDVQQEMQVVCYTKNASNKYYYCAYRKIEELINNEWRILNAQYNSTPIEKKKNAIRATHKALELVSTGKYKDKKTKERFIAEYTQAVIDAQVAYTQCACEEETKKALHIREKEQEALLHDQTQLLLSYWDEQKKVAAFVNTFNSGYCRRLENRMEACALMEKDGLSVTTAQYAIANHTLLYLTTADFDFTLLTSNTGNQYQQCIHQEIVTILDTAVFLPHYSPLRLQKETLIACSVSAFLYNQEGCIHTATLVTDFCWALLDYGNAIVEGVALGIVGAAQAVVIHPLDAVISVVAGQYIFVYQLGTLLYNTIFMKI